MALGPETPSSRPAATPSPESDVRHIVASPLPRAAEVYVPPGSYGAAPHVPFKPYVPPLPPKMRAAEASPAPLRVVTEDPLAFLAAQASQQPPRPPAPVAPVTRRFRPATDADAAPRPEARRGSVPPPGYR